MRRRSQLPERIEAQLRRMRGRATVLEECWTNSEAASTRSRGSCGGCGGSRSGWASGRLELGTLSRYLIGPAVCWSIFFFGATFIHLADAGSHGAVGHGGLLWIVASHGLISVLLTGSLLMAGVHRDGRAFPANPA